jgi:8-oxo-dGTP pyrophosphatase MutT (NUDIX family)
VPEIFASETEIKDYILQASSNPENVKLTPNGERILNYRHLTTKVGVSCYIIFQNKILILERSPLVKCSGTWGTVSGYVDNLEMIQNSRHFLRPHIIQELQEEIGWHLDESMTLKYCNNHALITPRCKIHFELFTLFLTQKPPKIKLNPEHLTYKWVELAEISSLRPILITQFIEGIEKCNLLMANS